MVYYIDFYCEDCHIWQRATGEEVEIGIDEYTVGDHGQIEVKLLGKCKECNKMHCLDEKIKMTCQHGAFLLQDLSPTR